MVMVMVVCLISMLVALQAACSQAASPVLRHSWNTASDFLYSHGKNKSGVLNAAEAEYLGSHYAYHTGGNCDGAGSFTPLSHEKAASVSLYLRGRIFSSRTALLTAFLRRLLLISLNITFFSRLL